MHSNNTLTKSQPRDKSVTSTRTALSSVTRNQLRDMVLAKFEREFHGDSAKLRRVEQIVDEHFATAKQKIGEEGLRALKRAVRDQLQSLDEVGDAQNGNNRYSKSQPQHNGAQQQKASSLQLPPIKQNSSNLTSTVTTKQHKDNAQDIYNNPLAASLSEVQLQQLPQQDLSSQLFQSQSAILQPQQQQQENGYHGQQFEPKSPHNHTNTLNYEKISEDLKDSERSVYSGGDGAGNEFALIVKADQKKFLREQEERRLKKLQEQKELRQDLDRLVNEKNQRRRKKLQEEQRVNLEITQREIDRQEERKRLEKQLLAEQERRQRDQRLFQIAEQNARQKILKEKELIQQQEEIRRVRREYEIQQKEETDRKLRERQFYDEVKRQEDFLKRGAQSINLQVSAPKTLSSDNSYEYSVVFEKNARQRIEQQQKRVQKIEEVQRPLLKIFDQPNPQEVKRSEKERVIEGFRQQKEQIEHEEAEKAARRAQLAKELQNSYAGMVEKRKERGVVEKEVDLVQADIWRREREEAERAARAREEQIRRSHAELQQYLKQQIQQQTLNKKSPQTLNSMTNEELLLNKARLRNIFQEENVGVLAKKQTADFRHIKRSIPVSNF